MMYDICRDIALVQREVPKPGGKETELRMVRMPTGFSFLPYPGGLLDQPAFIVDTFSEFLRAERTAAMRLLTK